MNRIIFAISLLLVVLSSTAQNKYLVKKVKGVYTTRPGLFDKEYKFEIPERGQVVYFDVKNADISLAGCDTSALSNTLPAKNGMMACIMNGYGKFIVSPSYTVAQEIFYGQYIMGRKLLNGMWEIEIVTLKSERDRVSEIMYFGENKDYRYINRNRIIYTGKDGKIGVIDINDKFHPLEAKYEDFEMLSKDFTLIDKSNLKYNSVEEYYNTNINMLTDNKEPWPYFFELFINGTKTLYKSPDQVFPNYTKITKYKDGLSDFYYVEFDNGKGDIAHSFDKYYYEENRDRLLKIVAGETASTVNSIQDPYQKVKGNYKNVVWTENGVSYTSRNNSNDWLVISVDSNNRAEISLDFVGSGGWIAPTNNEYKLNAYGVEVTTGVIQPNAFKIGDKPVNGYFFSMGSFVTEYELGKLKSISGWFNPVTNELYLTGERHGGGSVVIKANHE